jgi:hypothetical protein
MDIGHWWGSQKERDYWKDQDVDGWTILKWILVRDIGLGWYGWVDVVLDRDQWRALVNTVLNFRVP